MANLTLVYGMRLLPSDEVAEVGEAPVKLKNGREAHVTMHVLEGSKEEIVEGMSEAGKGQVKGGGEAGKAGPGHGADPGKLTEGMAEAGSGTATGVPADAERLKRP